MSKRSKISDQIQKQVRQRANYLCEYCHASEKWQYVKFTVDHVIPLNKEGKDNLDKLALACFHCNRQKSNKTTTISPVSGQNVSLFNPRQDNWSEHFVWSPDGLFLRGLTEKGIATVSALKMNRERVIAIRSADVAVGRHPPAKDPVQGKK